MKLTVQDLRKEFGLEDECNYIFHNQFFQGCVYIYGSLSRGSLILKFDNKIDYFEFLVEASYLIENNIWREIKFSSIQKSGLKSSTKKISEQESQCVECAIDINNKTQEILNRYIVKYENKEDKVLEDLICKTEQCLKGLKDLKSLNNII